MPESGRTLPAGPMPATVRRRAWPFRKSVGAIMAAVSRVGAGSRRLRPRCAVQIVPIGSLIRHSGFRAGVVWGDGDETKEIRNGDDN